MTLQPKTLDVISSYSIDELVHIFNKTRELKSAYQQSNQDILDFFRIDNPDFGVYEVFLEDSTRTKESFRNALEFHRVKAKIFDTASSSFNKSESYADTFNMLTWYDNQIFIVRSKLEWVCTRLDRNWYDYARRHSVKPPIFINAWDWKHEHPTQELLDQFTILEDNNRNRDHLHIALLWDLLHGRTVHSKVDWLRIYKSVSVDLIAPQLLQMPQMYIDQMKSYWYKVRIYDSIDEYLEQSNIATARYFTRLQLERMWEEILQQAPALRKKISITPEHISKLPSDNLKFYHPLPRHKLYPEIPTFLDNTPFNGRENQSRNGMFVRILVVAVAAWVPYVCDDFVWHSNPIAEFPLDYGTLADVIHHSHKHISEWVLPIDNGVVIDHIAKWLDVITIKERIAKIVRVLWLYGKWWDWISNGAQTGRFKWMIFRPWISLSDHEIYQLAALAPGSTYNHIINGQIAHKLRLSTPSFLRDISWISCKNLDCISHLSHHEQVPAEFIRKDNLMFECIYCNKEHQYNEVWD